MPDIKSSTLPLCSLVAAVPEQETLQHAKADLAVPSVYRGIDVLVASPSLGYSISLKNAVAVYAPLLP